MKSSPARGRKMHKKLTKRALLTLKKLELSGYWGDGGKCCPICFYFYCVELDSGKPRHASDCELKALITDIELSHTP
jgi:hypothetical protein